MSDKERPIIIIRKKKSGGGHGSHGAWKVAYADFVTAMMCFFMVMWLISMNDQTKVAIAGYFRDPLGYSETLAGQVGPEGTPAGSMMQVLSMRDAQKKSFEEAMDRLQAAIDNHPEFEQLQDYIDIQITEEGLLIELLDAEESFFFESGSARLKEKAQRLLVIIAMELGRLANPIVLEGHTDAAPFRTANNYTNWELSADRANAARQVMEVRGLRKDQVVEVRGYADRKLRNKEAPRHFSNRRVSILAKYVEQEDEFIDQTTNALDAALRANEAAKQLIEETTKSSEIPGSQAPKDEPDSAAKKSGGELKQSDQTSGSPPQEAATRQR